MMDKRSEIKRYDEKIQRVNNFRHEIKIEMQ